MIVLEDMDFTVKCRLQLEKPYVSGSVSERLIAMINARNIVGQTSEKT